MGLATAGCLRRIARLSWFGHQTRFPTPSVGWLARAGGNGHLPSPVSSFISPTTASGLSDTGILPGSGVCSRTGCGGAVGAQAPVDDLGLIDREAVVVRRGQAGCGADGAIDVGDHAAGTTHDVVVVVPGPRLVARDGTRGLDAPHQTRNSQRSQHVVDGLV